MLFNVLNNAVKHTPRGGSIVIMAGDNAGRFEVSICDTGRGMSREQLDKLFTRFSNTSGQATESMGLGLAITKSIADFHNIDIKVISEPGKGTQFFFSFPVNS